MIIGISGKIGSGKDLIGQIIQYLIVNKQFPNLSFNTFIDKDYNGYELCDWKIVKFADKLKDIVCLLTGCTREQLEDNEFKNSKLPSIWNKWKVIATTELFEDSIRYFNSKKEALRFCKKLDCGTYYTHTAPIQITLTYRELLQQIGTDLFRDQLHPNTWVNATMAEYKPSVSYHVEILNFNKGTRERVSEDFPLEYPNWIITDVRFPNELKAVKDRGGISIRVNRPMGGSKFEGTQEEWNKLVERNKQSQHESETALDNAKFDYVIENNGTIEYLIFKVKEILIKEDII